MDRCCHSRMKHVISLLKWTPLASHRGSSEKEASGYLPVLDGDKPHGMASFLCSIWNKLK